MAIDLRAFEQDLMYRILADEARYHDWTYGPVRPCHMPTTKRIWVPGTRVSGDCSKGVQFVDWWTPGAGDPMKVGFGPSGNSQTLWMRCQHLAHPSELELADIVTFGRDGADHAAKVIERGNDPLLWSFGHQGAPNSYRLSLDRRLHQLLRNPLAEYKPTHADLLRARTDWFAWMAWYQGEGDWQHYRPQDPKMRPDVPHRIPVTWWGRRLKFLAKRETGNKATTA